MDEIDRMQEAEGRMLDRAVASARRRPRRGPGPRNCVDCGQPIPAARRAAMPSASRCVGCQRDFEADGP